MILDTRQDPRQGTFGQYMTGSWAQWLDALKAVGGDNVRLRGGPAQTNPHYSNQIRGYSVQPDYLTTGKTFMGRPTSPKPPAGFTASALAGLQQAQAPRPHEVVGSEAYVDAFRQNYEDTWQGEKRRTYAPSDSRTGQSYLRILGQRGGPRA